MKEILLMCVLMQPSYKRPTVTGNVYFAETFESEEDFKHRCIGFIDLVNCTVKCAVMWHVLSVYNHRQLMPLVNCNTWCIYFIGISSFIVHASLLHLWYFLINSKHIAVDLLIDCL